MEEIVVTGSTHLKEKNEMMDTDEYVKQYEAIRYARDLATQNLKDLKFTHQLLNKVLLEICLNANGLYIEENDCPCLNFVRKQFKNSERQQIELLKHLDWHL